MMMKDPKTGEFYDVDLRDPRQSEEAAKKGLVYACTHYFPPGEVGGECPVGVGDIREFWRATYGIDVDAGAVDGQRA